MFIIGTFQVVEGLTAASASVLGRSTAIELGILKVGHPLQNPDFVAATAQMSVLTPRRNFTSY